MKLKTIQVFPSGPNGLGTDPLEFGAHITHLFGPNGSGKTPLVQSIAFCLGYPSEFRNEIYDRCSHAVLQIEISGKPYSIKRIYARDTDIEVTLSNGSTERFLKESEYSNYIFDCLNLSPSNLTTNKDAQTKAYLATLLPLFYAEQKKGYTSIYVPPKSFIKDQFSEMIRLIFDLPVKHPFDAKKAQYKAKRKLEALDRRVYEKSKQIEILKEFISNNSISPSEVQSEIQRLESELNTLKGEGSARDDSVTSLDRLIATNNQNLQDLSLELRELRKRKQGIGTIVSEINSEINALNLNEEARRIFLSFNEVCRSENCQLFSNSSEAYAKNLLYLKDQLKDLQKDDSVNAENEEKIQTEISTLTNVIKNVVEERNRILEKSDIESVVIAVTELKNEIFRLQAQLDDLLKLDFIEKEYVIILGLRNSAFEEYKAYKNSSSSNPELAELRADLRQFYLRWIDELHTPNVSRDITFKDDFMPILGGEKIGQLGASTAVRAILAFHAALTELTADRNTGLRFLILDTPKQHEIHNDDLDIYFKALKKLCIEHNLQIIFSTTEYKYEGDEFDRTYVPQYPGIEQPMFMKEANSLSSTPQ